MKFSTIPESFERRIEYWEMSIIFKAPLIFIKLIEVALQELVYPVSDWKLGGPINVVTLFNVFEDDPLTFVATKVVKYLVELLKLFILIFTLLGDPTLQYTNEILLVKFSTIPELFERRIEYWETSVIFEAPLIFVKLIEFALQEIVYPVSDWKLGGPINVVTSGNK